jgi:branched-chain amino acid transport system permease protein
MSVMALSMVIVGGLGSIPGAILGAIIMVGINSIVLAKLADWLSNMSSGSSNVLLSPGNWKYMIFGLALVLMMRFKSEGLMPSRNSGER